MNNIYESKIIEKVDNKIYKVKSFNSEIEKKIVYPKGLLSNPKKDEMCITIQTGSQYAKQYVIPLEVNENNELGEQDVMVTDGKSTIHLKFGDGIVSINSKKLIIEGDLEVKGSSNFGGSMVHGGKHVDSTHFHDPGKVVSGPPSIPSI